MILPTLYHDPFRRLVYCSDGLVTVAAPITRTYQWYFDDVLQVSETARLLAYDYAEAQAGVVVRCEVTTNGVTVSSAPVTLYDATQWIDMTIQPSYSFTRATVASDGAPETGLPAHNVSFYASGELREVSSKLGLTDQPTYLLEGARTNISFTTLSRNSSAVASTSTISTTYTGPSGDANLSLYQMTVSNARTQVITQNADTADSTTYAVSASVKAAFIATDPDVLFDFLRRDGTVATLNISLPFEWQRFHQVVDSGAGASTTTIRTRNGDADERHYAQAFNQIEQGQFPSSYIDVALSNTPTTRAADVMSCALQNAWGAGTLVFYYRPEHSSAQHVAHGSTLTLLRAGVYSISIVVDAGASKVQMVTLDGTFLTGGLTYNAGDEVRVELDWANEQIRVYVAAVLVATTAFTGIWNYASPVTANIGHNAGEEHVFGALSIGRLPLPGFGSIFIITEG